MPGPRTEGFLGGLLEGVAGALYEKQAQKHQEQLQANQTLAGVMLRGLDQDPTRETASAVLPKIAELLHMPLQSIFGGGIGKGKRGKSSPLGDPEAISGLFEGLAGAFPSRADVMQRQAQGDAQTAQKAGMVAEASETGKLRAQSADQAKELDRLNVEYEKAGGEGTLGMTRREYFEERGFFKAPTQRAPVGDKDLTPDPTSPTGFVRKYFNADGSLARTEVARDPKISTRSHLTGEALQAYDMNQMLAGIDPETGQTPKDPEDAKRLIAAGQEMKRSRDAKNTALVIKIDAGKESKDDIKELAPQVANGSLLPSQLGSMGGTQRLKVMAEANRLRRADGLPPLNYRQMQLEYYGAQRLISSLNGPQMTRFKGLAGSVVNTINEVNALADELEQGGVQKFNAAKRGTILQVYGNTPQSETAVRYVSAVNTLKEEFANLAQGGYAPTESAWKLAHQQINTDYGVKDLKASLVEAQRLINFRLGAFDQLEVGGLGNVSGGSDQSGTGATPSGSVPGRVYYDANGNPVKK